MRIVVSGTHASGKSTLVSDFALRHPQFTVLPDPFELVDESWDAPGASMFAAQLRVAADRLRSGSRGEGRGAAGDVIAERGPIDFLAYLQASAELAGTSVPDDLLDRAITMTAEALREVDLLVVLPLTARDPIPIGPDEYPELREAMNEVLLELVDDPDIVSDSTTVLELTGEPLARLAALEAAAAHPSRTR